MNQQEAIEKAKELNKTLPEGERIRFVAMDEDVVWWGFHEKPRYDVDYGIWVSDINIHLGEMVAAENSLAEVPQ